MKRLIHGPTLLVSQYGDKFYASSLKELRQKVPGHVSRMYVDRKDGAVCHVGYVIGRLWLTAYKPAAIVINR